MAAYLARHGSYRRAPQENRGRSLPRFGKGRHPAALTFGDCPTYATAKLADRPQLFVGNDFGKTDLPAA